MATEARRSTQASVDSRREVEEMMGSREEGKAERLANKENILIHRERERKGILGRGGYFVGKARQTREG